MSAARCPRQACGATLRFMTDGRGREVAVCDPCERNAAGLCRDCPSQLPIKPARRDGRGGVTPLRCDKCKAIQTKKVKAAFYERNRDETLAALKRKWREDRSFRQKGIERSRAWRVDHPTTWTAEDSQYSKAWRAAKAKNTAWRERQNRLMARRRWRKRKAELRKGNFTRLFERDRRYLALIVAPWRSRRAA